MLSALREALFGNGVLARQHVAGATRGSSGRDLDFAVSLTFANVGDAKRGRALAERLDEKFPEDTIVQFNYLPPLRAKLALLQGNPTEALAILRAATSCELGLPALGFYNWPNLYPVYVRGEAYLAAHQGKEAAAEFQKISTIGASF